jgi:hypothetical protein
VKAIGKATVYVQCSGECGAKYPLGVSALFSVTKKDAEKIKKSGWAIRATFGTGTIEAYCPKCLPTKGAGK